MDAEGDSMPPLRSHARLCLRANLLAILFILSTVAAPADAATIRGVVLDPDGRAVAGARVIASDAGPGHTDATTDASGRFELPSVRAGEHELRVVVEGFTADPVRVRATDGSPTEITIALRVSAVSEALTVSAAHVDLPLSQTASTITIVSAEELEARQIRTVGDALAYVPGLSVARHGGFQSLTSLFTRGGEADFTLVLLDGVRMNAFGGGIDLSQVPLVGVERIEVVRGPQSAVFGSDAVGGVIQLVSRRGARPFVETIVEGGSFATVRGRVSAGGSAGAWSWDARAERAQSDGFDGIAPATGERVSNDEGRAQHFGVGGGWRGTGGAEWRATAMASFTERGFPGPYGSNPIGAYQQVDRISRGENDRAQGGLQWLQPWGGDAGRIRQRTEVSVANLDSRFASPFGLSDSASHRVSVRTQADTAISRTLGLSAGLEVQRERANSTFITDTGASPVPVRRQLEGYFVEARHTGGNRWSVAGGVRVEHIRRGALAANDNLFAPRPAFDRHSTIAANPRISATYIVADDGRGNTTRVRASAGAGIRPPDALEIAFTDNPELKPERSRSGDVGVQQTFGGGTVLVDATAFFNRYDDLIVAVGRSFQDASRYRTDNISNARSRGLEIAARIRPASAFDVNVNYTLLDTEILAVDRTDSAAPPPYSVGDPLIRRPRHRGSVSAAYSRGRVTAFARALARGRLRDVEPSFGAFGGVFTSSGYTALDVGGAVRVSRYVAGFARLDNAAGRRYEEAFGFPAPGRVFTAGVRVSVTR